MFQNQVNRRFINNEDIHKVVLPETLLFMYPEISHFLMKYNYHLMIIVFSTGYICFVGFVIDAVPLLTYNLCK